MTEQATPVVANRALDFGCGVERLTQARAGRDWMAYRYFVRKK
jgi:hypothetical protein